MALPNEELGARNDRLRAAVLDSGLSTDEVATRAGVDPKTLERWIAGRVPHPRNRHALAEVLGVHPGDLWPDTDLVERLAPRHLAGVQGIFPSRSAFLSVYSPESLFAGATAISLAGLSNNLLCQQYADLRLEQLVCLGASLTCLFLEPHGVGTAAREAEERYEPGHLANLTQLNITLMQRLRDRLPEAARSRLFLATYDQTIRFNIVIVERGPENIAVVQPYLPHSRGVESPTLVVHPTSEPGLFDTFERVFQELKAAATPC